jgi:hypothetical protein
MSEVDPELEQLLDLALSLPVDAPNVMATPEHIAEVLWTYGEEEAEARIRSRLTEEQHLQICVAAGKIAMAEGGLLDHALARGAIVALEGADRPLARKRRRFPQRET